MNSSEIPVRKFHEARPNLLHELSGLTRLRRSVALSLTLGLILLGAAQTDAQTMGTARPGGVGGIGGGVGGIGGIGGVGGAGGIGAGAGSTLSIRQYTNSTMLGDAMITSDMESRNLIVVSDEATYQIIRKIVADLDRPRPQVLIDCVFVQVTHTNELDLGTEMTFHGGSSTATSQYGLGLANPTGATVSGVPDLGAGLITTAASAGTVPTSSSASSNGVFYSLVTKDVNATIHALAAVNKTEVLSRPSVLTRNNQQATILVGEAIPIITSSTVSTLTGAPTNTIEQQDIGIILKVTPFITAEGNIEMILDPQISSLSATTVPIGNNTTYPVINMISADTVVVTPNNQTVVIGGLMQNQKTETENKVPLLGDIPLLGYAFKYKTSNNQKTELIIFLTPHIVRDPSELAQLTADEHKRMELAPSDFSKAELKKYEIPAK
jgi:general secretion pathway protein D